MCLYSFCSLLGRWLGSLSWFPYPFHVVIEGNSHAISLAQHLTGHESVEDTSACQRQAEIEAKKPPVLHISVELHAKQKGHKE